jgi:hypothetical protein
MYGAPQRPNKKFIILVRKQPLSPPHARTVLEYANERYQEGFQKCSPEIQRVTSFGKCPGACLVDRSSFEKKNGETRTRDSAALGVSVGIFQPIIYS